MSTYSQPKRSYNIMSTTKLVQMLLSSADYSCEWQAREPISVKSIYGCQMSMKQYFIRNMEK